MGQSNGMSERAWVSVVAGGVGSFFAAILIVWLRYGNGPQSDYLVGVGIVSALCAAAYAITGIIVLKKISELWGRAFRLKNALQLAWAIGVSFAVIYLIHSHFYPVH